MSRSILFALIFFWGILPVGAQGEVVAPYIGVVDQSPALHDVRGLIESVPAKFASLKIKGTCSAKYLTKTYSAAYDHIQGITMVGNYFVIAQSTGNLSSREKRTLLVVGNGRNRCSFHLVGTRFPHCGGIQACGNIVAVAVEPRYDGKKHHGKGSEVLFIDFTDPGRPIELPLIAIG